MLVPLAALGCRDDGVLMSNCVHVVSRGSLIVEIALITVGHFCLCRCSSLLRLVAKYPLRLNLVLLVSIVGVGHHSIGVRTPSIASTAYKRTSPVGGYGSLGRASVVASLRGPVKRLYFGRILVNDLDLDVYTPCSYLLL